MSHKEKNLLLVILLLLNTVLSSCTFYKWEVISQPTSQEAASERTDRLYYNFPQYFTRGPAFAPPSHIERIVEPVFQAFQQSLAIQTPFKNVILISQVPEKGIYCSISVQNKQISSATRLFQLLSVGTLTVIPFYDTTGGYMVHYALYIDGDLKKEYKYEVSQKSLFWIGGLFVVIWSPDGWSGANAFAGTQDSRTKRPHYWTQGVADTLASTATLFALDAHHDGYF
jgi:hypothetical protein